MAGIGYRRRLASAFTFMVMGVTFALAQFPRAASHGNLVTAPIVEADRVVLSAGLGGTLPFNAQDLGAAPANQEMRRVMLVLKRSTQQEAALAILLQSQQMPGSSEFHHWMTPEEFGIWFGPADDDLSVLTDWLRRQGFTSVASNRGRTGLEFSGTTTMLNRAFRADLHSYAIPGSTFYANAGSFTVPRALAGIVGGIASFRPVAWPEKMADGKMYRRDGRTGVTVEKSPGGVSAQFTLSSNNTIYYGITPYDFAAIYNVAPLWSAATPIDGTGQTIAVVGQTDIDPADFVAFRHLFSLPLGDPIRQTGTQYLNIIYNGPKPAVRAEEFHANSDTQWAAAIAKGAVIDYVASQSTEASSGNDLSAAYIVDNNLAPVMVYSYPTCELKLGTGGNAFYESLWQQASAQGISVVAPSGDSGAAGCDATHIAPAMLGAAVNGVGSTPFNVSVGGTEFSTPGGVAAYFRATNDAQQASAIGYIPEAVWNDSCTNAAIYGSAPYTGLSAEQTCNSTAAQQAGLATVIGSGGGSSACTTSDGMTPSTCTGGYAKPAWQTAGARDNFRDVPDVSFFASQGRTNTFYVVCQQSRDADGKVCNLDFPYSDFAGYGGTEIAAPAFAGVLALVAQKTGQRVGNPNYVLYGLAAREAATCSGTASGTGCVFHDITLGTNAMPCAAGSPSCLLTTAGDKVGIESVAGSAAGYDQATGLGSVNVANLVNSWTSVGFKSTTSILTVSPSSVMHGESVTATVNVSAVSTLPATGQVSLNAQVGNGSVGSGPLSAGTFRQTFRNFPGGSYGVQSHYEGDGQNAASDSNFVALTVSPEPSTTTLNPLSFDPVSGAAKSVSNAPYGSIFYLSAGVSGRSGQGIASGNVMLTDNGTILGSGVYRLNSSGYTEAQNNSLPPGSHSFSAAYSGDSSFLASNAATAALTITRAPTIATVMSDKNTVSTGSTVTLFATIATQSFGFQGPSGTVTFAVGGQTIGSSVLLEGTDSVTFYRNGTATFTVSASNFPLGPAAVTVTYPGNGNYENSTSAASSLAVTGTTLAASSTMVSVTPSTMAPGGAITFLAAVTPLNPAPSGTVQFAVDGQNTGGAVLITSGGLAGLATKLPLLKPGTHVVVAVYSGDLQHYRSSTSAAVQFIIATPGATAIPSLTANPGTVVRGTFIAVPSVVRPLVKGGTVPTGTVQLVLDGSPYGSSLLLSDGAVTLPLVTPTIQVGSHVLTIFYAGDGVYAPSYAVPVTIVVTATGTVASSVTLSKLAQQVDLGTDVTFVAQLLPASPTPTGVLQVIYDGGNPSAPILLAGASESLTIRAVDLTLGTHTVNVFYSGDARYSFSLSQTISFTVVQPGPPVGTFTMSPESVTLSASRVGSSPTTSFTVTPANGFHYPVTFSCANLPANTVCSFSPATVTFSSSTAATTVVTILLNTGIKAAVTRRLRLVDAMVVCGLAGFFLLGLRGPRRLQSLALSLAMTAVMLLLISGCGSGYAPGTSTAGTFQVKVVATGGNVTQTSNVTLTIR